MASQMAKFKAERSPLQNAILAMVLALLCWFLLSAVPTQWFAWKMNYDRELGEPLWIGHTYAAYMPTDWVLWGWKWADYAPMRGLVDTMMFLGLGSAGLGMGSALLFLMLLGRQSTGMDELHGSAHWADATEVDATGFLSSKTRKVDGAMVGSVLLDKNHMVIHPLHPKFGQRYQPLMGWKDPGSWRQWLKMCNDRGEACVSESVARLMGGAHLRDKDGVPRWAVRKAIVKQIELLRADDPTHILAFAPTRSGKGVGLVLPTLLTWRHSVLINDIKGENWALTAGFRRAAGQITMKFEPACLDGSSCCWNPLDEIRLFTPMDVQDAQGMMMMVCDPKGEGLEDHWAKTSWEFLTGLALHLAYTGEQGNLAGMASYLGDPRWEDEKQMYLIMGQTEHDPEGKAGWIDTGGLPTKIHPAIANAAKTMLNKEDKERGSVLSTAKSFLSLYLDPVVAANTSKSNFLVRDLMNSDKPVSLYFVVQPADLERMVPLSRLFWAMVIRRNAADMHFAGGSSVQGYKHRLLLLIDELPALKKLSVLQEGLGYIAGYGLKCYLICQDLIQLRDAYGDKQTIVAGCKTRIAYAPNTQETADELAKMTGKTTIIEETASKSRDSWGWKAGNVSLSTSKTERDLMTSSEFMALNPDDMVLFVAGSAPIYGRKIKYYEDPVMLQRAKMPAPEKSDVLRVARPAAGAAGHGSALRAGEKGSDGGSATSEVTAKVAADRAAWQRKMAIMVSGVTGGDGGGGLEPGDYRPPGVAVERPTAAAAVQSGKKSFYASKVKMELTETERAEIQAIVQGAGAGVTERIAQFTVF